MSRWSEIYELFDLPSDGCSDIWQILGVSDGATKSQVDKALNERRKLLLNITTIEALEIHKFESEVLMPAYIEACESIETIELKEEDLGSYDLLDSNDDQTLEEFGLKPIESNEPEPQEDDEDEIHLVQPEMDYGDLAEEDSRTFGDLLDKSDHSNLDDETIEPDEFLALPDDYDITGSQDVNDDSDDIPVLEAVDQSDSDVDGILLAKDDDVPTAGFADSVEDDDIPDDLLDKLTSNNDTVILEEHDDEEEEIESIDERPVFSPEKLFSYLLAIVPVIILVVFAIFLFKSDPEPVEDIKEPVVTESKIPAAPVKKVEPLEKFVKEEYGFDFVSQEVPPRFILLLEELAASYSYEGTTNELLEDIIVTLQAWQIIAGNEDEFDGFTSMLQSGVYRNNGTIAFEMDEYALNNLKSMKQGVGQAIELPADYYQKEFGDSDSARRNRIIELAGVSGGNNLRDMMLKRLIEKESYNTMCRIIRIMCCWFSNSDQLEMLNYITHSRRDLARKVFNNLNMRYNPDEYGQDEPKRYLKYSFNRPDVEQALDWWQSNILTIKSNKRVRKKDTAQDDISLSEYKAVLLAAVWKNSYMLNCVLRNSVFLPPLAPDMEISGKKELPVDKVLAASMENISNGLLAVIFDLFSSQDTEVMNDIDIIRYTGLEYDFVDINLRAQAKANEILIYCKLMKGEKYETKNAKRIDNKKDTYLTVRDSLFEALKRYASGNIVNYAHAPESFYNFGTEVVVDYGLVNQYLSSESVTSSDLDAILEQLRKNPFSKELYAQASKISMDQEGICSEGIVYLQLGIRALKEKRFGAGTAIAIDCFKKAMKWPASRSVLENNMPTMAKVLAEQLDFICPECGNSGYIICEKCEGNLFDRCGTCKGNGVVVVKNEGRQYCPDCGGYGKEICSECGGSGVKGCLVCYDYVTDLDLFLPDEQQLLELQQAVNLAALKMKVDIRYLPEQEY